MLTLVVVGGNGRLGHITSSAAHLYPKPCIQFLMASPLTCGQFHSPVLTLSHVALDTWQSAVQRTWLLENHSIPLYFGDGLIWFVCPASVNPLKSIYMLS